MANTFFDESELRSVTVLILSLTFFMAVVVSDANVLKAVVFTPETVVTSVATLFFMRSKSVELVRSIVLSLLVALVFITSFLISLNLALFPVQKRENL